MEGNGRTNEATTRNLPLLAPFCHVSAFQVPRRAGATGRSYGSHRTERTGTNYNATMCRYL